MPTFLVVPSSRFTGDAGLTQPEGKRSIPLHSLKGGASKPGAVPYGVGGTAELPPTIALYKCHEHLLDHCYLILQHLLISARKHSLVLTGISQAMGVCVPTQSLPPLR
ncbi:hypothetical protein KIL84_000206 [Mauremys mutica]|uniref:Uncharacterized protein n=1 Tax=Mauremys mutica TaxID=74926 RepID=A0A9D4B3I0_9SAUR|nr:hypothetical protein KIL84_000206 [Mauremys mutica]